MCEHCTLTPAQRAKADQTISAFKDGVTRLVEQVDKYLDEGDDDDHAAASAAISLSATATLPQVCSLLGFALVRLAHLRRAELCPCLPGAPKHEHLTGGYALTDEERSAVEWRLAHGQPAWPTDEARP